MSDCMKFPDDINEFIDDYSFKDSQEIYTNGSELIPTFRVNQALEHFFDGLKADRDYWKTEAQISAAKLGEIRILLGTKG